MNPRLAVMAILGREVAVPALVLAWIGMSGLAAIDNTRAAPVAEHLAPSLAADAKFSDKLTDTHLNDIKLNDIKLTSTSIADTKTADARPADPPVLTDDKAVDRNLADDKPADKLAKLASAAPDLPPPSGLSLASSAATVIVSPDAMPAAVAHATEPIVTATLTDPAETIPPETSPESDGVTPAIANREPGDVSPASQANKGIGSIEVLDECFAIDVCIDRYLWSLYQRTPKEDTVKIDEQRQVSIKRKGKMVTVTRTFSRRADQDFSWKDPKAAEKVGMSMADYVIGGMDRDFKLKLFHLLLAAEQIGMSPGITSAFRDDYRQSIASGLKAASNRSYHGGSLRGGYGHGLAADVVSVNGATRAQRLTSSQAFWKWIDTRGKDYGVGRPYLDHDPPHVGPIDGKEYADKHPSARQAESAAKPAHHRTAKRVRTARS
jgi:hypothetical protein